jgi:FdhD protein
VSVSSPTRRVPLERADGHRDDTLVVEEPLEIRVDDRPLAVVMRTPGDDLDLVAGFLLTEGVIDALDDLAALSHCTEPLRENAGNIVIARLAAGTRLDPARVDQAARALFSASSCGLCGKETIDRVFQRVRPLPPDPRLPSVELLAALPDRLRAVQPVFDETGGCHGAALFDAAGTLLVAREDIGRHNAVDKCLGARLRAGHTAEDAGLILVVSGRAGFEVVQKAVMGRVSALVAVGAASTLAHDLAVSAGLKLFTFARGGRANVHGGGGGV